MWGQWMRRTRRCRSSPDASENNGGDTADDDGRLCRLQRRCRHRRPRNGSRVSGLDAARQRYCFQADAVTRPIVGASWAEVDMACVVSTMSRLIALPSMSSVVSSLVMMTVLTSHLTAEETRHTLSFFATMVSTILWRAPGMIFTYFQVEAICKESKQNYLGCT